MKTAKIFLFILLAFPLVAYTQDRVQAEDILDLINDGQPVRFQNAVISGDLDFTSIEDVTAKKPLRVSRWSTQTYDCHVRSEISFIGCTFRGDVLAYVHLDKKNETYNAIFYEDVNFEGCEFQEASAFKYVEFKKDANFKNTEYSEEALFKYTEFSSEISFADSVFYGTANFKYAKFPEEVDFSETVFHRHADFKYTKFPEGVSFENAEFDGLANFKYTKFSEPLNLDGAEFSGDTDFKYTKIDGRSFTTYLLKRKSKR